MSSEDFDTLVSLLREELSGYGGLLALFDEQQNHLWRREAEHVTGVAETIETLASETAGFRVAREEFVRCFALSQGASADSTLRELLSYFPPDLQLLLQALITEINHLIHRVRRRARQNQSLLRRAVELQRESVAFLQPGYTSRTYAPTGRLAAGKLPGVIRAAG